MKNDNAGDILGICRMVVSGEGCRFGTHKLSEIGGRDSTVRTGILVSTMDGIFSAMIGNSVCVLDAIGDILEGDSASR